ncbi:MAG: PH domain-containing protein [Angelakisella sp.]
MTSGEIVWQDRKRNIFGLPWTFTKYILTDKKLLISSGFLNKNEEEVRLYRIMDVTLRCTILDRMFRMGTIHCCSADKSTPDFDIIRVLNAQEVKNKLSDLIEAERMARRVGMRELMDDGEAEV